MIGARLTWALVCLCLVSAGANVYAIVGLDGGAANYIAGVFCSAVAVYLGRIARRWPA